METNSETPNESSRAADGVVELPSGGVASSRAARLLERLIRRQLASADGLAAILGISRQRLLKYVAGKTRMPLDSQRRLAGHIVKHVPDLAREARRLELQCEAAERFHSGETTTHMVARPSRFR